MNRLDEKEDSVTCVEEEEKEEEEIDRSSINCRASGGDWPPRMAAMGVDVMDIVVGVDADKVWREVDEDKGTDVDPGTAEAVCNAVM